MAPKTAAKPAYRNFCLVDSQTKFPVEAFKIPAEWAAYGNVVWKPNDSVNFVIWNSRFVNPTTGSGASIISSILLSTMGGSANHQFISNPSSLANGFKEDLHNLVGQVNAQTTKAFYASDPNAASLSRLRKLVGELRSRIPGLRNERIAMFQADYTFQKNGKPWKAVAFTPVASVDYPAGRVLLGQIIVDRPIIIAAPASQYEAFCQKALAALGTCRSNPQWQVLRDKLALEISNAYCRNLQEQTQVLMKNQREISDMQMDSYRKRSDSQDRINKGWSNYMRDVEEVPSPYDSGTNVVIDSRSNHAWIKSGNEVLYTDSDFNPNTSPSFNQNEWTQVK